MWRATQLRSLQPQTRPIKTHTFICWITGGVRRSFHFWKHKAMIVLLLRRATAFWEQLQAIHELCCVIYVSLGAFKTRQFRFRAVKSSNQHYAMHLYGRHISHFKFHVEAVVSPFSWDIDVVYVCGMEVIASLGLWRADIVKEQNRDAVEHHARAMAHQHQLSRGSTQLVPWPYTTWPYTTWPYATLCMCHGHIPHGHIPHGHIPRSIHLHALTHVMH